MQDNITMNFLIANASTASGDVPTLEQILATAQRFKHDMRKLEAEAKKWPAIRPSSLVERGKTIYFSPQALIKSAGESASERMADEFDRGILYLHPDDHARLLGYLPLQRHA